MVSVEQISNKVWPSRTDSSSRTRRLVSIVESSEDIDHECTIGKWQLAYQSRAGFVSTHLRTVATGRRNLR